MGPDGIRSEVIPMFKVHELYGRDDLGGFDDIDTATRAAHTAALDRALATGESTIYLVTGDDGSLVLRDARITIFPGGRPGEVIP